MRHLLQEALVVHVSIVLVEKTMASHHALARYKLEKVWLIRHMLARRRGRMWHLRNVVVTRR